MLVHPIPEAIFQILHYLQLPILIELLSLWPIPTKFEINSQTTL